jgi:hypothetical protein
MINIYYPRLVVPFGHKQFLSLIPTARPPPFFSVGDAVIRPFLTLFQAIPIIDLQKTRTTPIHATTIPFGFVFAPEVIGNYSDEELAAMIPEIEQAVGLTKEKMNRTFHKSWEKVKNAPPEQLILEQLLHYVTTYGFRDLGIYSAESIYIPYEALNIPEIRAGQIKLTIIHGYTHSQLQEKVKTLLSTGVALKETTIKALMECITALNFREIKIDDVKNKEVKCRLCDYLQVTPDQPVEFLRYLIFKATNNTLIIKNDETIESIKAAVKNNSEIANLYEKFERKNGLEPLASIFYRFKPLFLAFKTQPLLRHTINRIRKLAITYHQPMPEDYLNTYTAKIKHKEPGLDQLRAVLAHVNPFRKVRLAYALNYRLHAKDAIMFKIRNRKSFATGFDAGDYDQKLVRESLDLVLTSLVEDLTEKIRGKTIYFDPLFTYALPATEKQFSGNIPCGSFITLPSNMIIGIHWENLPDEMVDLDLSLMGCTKFGWDGQYRSDGSSDILFSGDITDAPDGATEAFYIQKQVPGTYLLMVNHFNRGRESSVPFKMFVARASETPFGYNYTVDPNNVEMIIPNMMDARQKMLGLLLVNPTNTVFYIGETNIGNTITSKQKTFILQARIALETAFMHPILLQDLLLQAGGKKVDRKDRADIDLSVEALQKDIILKLLQ